MIAKKMGSLIRQYRERKNFTQLEFAKKLGYSTPQFVSLFERGLSKVPPAKLRKISEILDIDQNVFIQMITDEYSRKLKLLVKKGDRL